MRSRFSQREQGSNAVLYLGKSDIARYYAKADPNKGDIILFHYPKDPSRHLIKRIIATENDVLESRNKVIYVNGLMLKEFYVQHDDNNIDNGPRDNFGPIRIPKGKIFVMGDNRDESYDGRFWGPIDKAQIMGKSLYIYWSKKISRIGTETK
jgi:signal peptidase I